MRNKNILTDLDKYVVYVNVDNKETLYAMSREEFEKKRNITKNYDNREANVPDEFTINVFPMGIVSTSDFATDDYDIISETTISIPPLGVASRYVLFNRHLAETMFIKIKAGGHVKLNVAGRYA